MERHRRQMRLAGVGPAGQARIARACVEVGEQGAAAEVATAYLAGAGVGSLTVRSAALERVAHAVDPSIAVRVEPALEEGPGVGTYDLRHPSARALAAGARSALLAIRRALEAS